MQLSSDATSQAELVDDIASLIRHRETKYTEFANATKGIAAKAMHTHAAKALADLATDIKNMKIQRPADYWNGGE